MTSCPLDPSYFQINIQSFPNFNNIIILVFMDKNPGESIKITHTFMNFYILLVSWF